LERTTRLLNNESVFDRMEIFLSEMKDTSGNCFFNSPRPFEYLLVRTPEKVESKNEEDDIKHGLVEGIVFP
jgi:hypothetical protein